MALVSAKEIDGRGGAIDVELQGTYTRVFQVITDNPLDGPLSAMSAIGIRRGDVYFNGQELDPNAFATDIRADPAGDADDARQWVVTVDYGPLPPRQDNPLDEPPEVEWGFAQFEEVCDQDVFGVAILNSAGDYFDPPVVRDDSRTVLTVTRNEADFSARLAADHRDRINAAPFFGQARHCVKCSSITGTRQFVAGLGFYWKVRYEFHFDDRTFHKTILNQGLREKVAVVRKQIMIDQELPASSPVLLDSTGRALPPGGTPVYRTFQVYREADFSIFNFPGQ